MTAAGFFRVGILRLPLRSAVRRRKGAIEGISAENSAVANHPTPLYVRLLAGLVRPFPNFDFSFIKPVRHKATAMLRLRPGHSVLDVGCGSGGAFPSLVRAVGTAGKVVGVEISPASAAHARHRAAANQWSNVEVLLASAQEARLLRVT
jgi:SAM-dependent methyltransferase